MFSNERFSSRLLMVGDATVWALCFYASIALRTSFQPIFNLETSFQASEHVWLVPSALLLHLVLGSTFRIFQPFSENYFLKLTKASFSHFLFLTLSLAALAFLVKAQSTSRFFMASYLALAFLMQWILRWALYRIYIFQLRDEFHQRKVILLHTLGDRPEHLAKLRAAIRPLGHLSSEMAFESTSQQDLEELLKTNPIDQVFVSFQVTQHPRWPSLQADFLARGLVIHHSLELPVPSDFQPHVKWISNHELLFTSEKPILSPEAALMKRTIDLFFSTLGLLVTGLITPIIGLAIKMETKGPIFFRQIRVGQGGRRFTCYKFRTMVENAERELPALQQSNQMQGPLFKIERDPRITKVGAFLRKSSLDEFPQFLNVFRGEMSLIGTRPPTPTEVAQYAPKDFKRISIKPGLTGLWQVSGRNQISRFEDVLALDVQYIDQWSPLLDLKIIFRTFLALLSRKGAV